jgi:hypothetical protein
MPLLSNFGLEYAIKKFRGGPVKLNGTYQFLDYADDVNLLGDNIHRHIDVNHDMKLKNRSLESVALFICLGKLVTNQNFIQEENKRRLIRAMLATILSRTFRLFFCCLKT